MIEKKGFYYGADISGGGGSGATHIVCDDLGNNGLYTLAEVDEQGVVVRDSDEGLQRLTVKDLNAGGVCIFDSGRDNPVLAPGEKLVAKVGPHRVSITATENRGVIFNGEKPTELTKDLEITRYPGQYQNNI